MVWNFVRRSTVNAYCDNCNRNHVDLMFADEVKRSKKFCYLRKQTCYMLCPLCHAYCTSKNDGKIAVNVFPAFIWNILANYDRETFNEAWKMLPKQWKTWWQDRIRTLYPGAIVQDDDSISKDVTELVEYYQQHLTEKSMATTKWVDFNKCVEKTLVIPTVRCPFGCSEMVGKCKSIPLDIFFQRYISSNISMYSNNKKHYSGFRRDLFDKKIKILNKWDCTPCYAFIEEEPRVLTCRYHTLGNHLQYIHPPTNPTNDISFPADNKLAQVTAIPRTVKTFKSRPYTNTYQINKVMGNFEGIDSMNLCSESLRQNDNMVTRRRDKFVIQGRPDCLNYCKDGDFPYVTSDDVKEAEQMLTPEESTSLKLHHLNGGTYVAVQDNVEVERRHKMEPTRMIRIPVQNTNPVSYVEKTFVPQWPSPFVRVLPSGTQHGEPFPLVKFQKNDFGSVYTKQIATLVLNSIHVITELWNIIDKSVKANDTWQGWILSYLTKELDLSRKRGTRGNPFSVGANGSNLKKQSLLFANEIFKDTSDSARPRMEEMKEMFKDIPEIHVGASFPQGEALDGKEVVFVFFDPDTDDTFRFEESVDDFEVRFISVKEQNDGNNTRKKETQEIEWYCRYGGKFNLFWHYKILNRSTFQRRKLVEPFGDLYSRVASKWYFAVYVRKTKIDFQSIQKDLLRLQRGQFKVQCNVHHYPMIILPSQKNNKTKCCVSNCGKKGKYVCPHVHCGIHICNGHMSEYSTRDEVTYVKETDDEESSDNDTMNEESSDDSSYVYDDTSSDESALTHVIDSTSVESENSINVLHADYDDFDSKNSGSSHSQNLDIPMHGNDEDTIVSEADSNDTGYAIPTTNAGRELMEFDVSALHEEGKLIPNHVILNSGGGALLLRRHKELKPNQKSQHFLQRLTATSEGTNVPLLYPEATMFPSLFWLSNEDAAVIGSYPLSCLADNHTLNSMGIESLYDMCRTRILDPSLLSSTSPTYQAFLWDMIANLGMRGCNSEVILRRGWADALITEGLTLRKDECVFSEDFVDSRKTINQLAAANARQPNDLFFTWTLNAMTTPAINIIKQWTSSPECLQAYEKEFFEQKYNNESQFWDLEDERIMQDAIEESACIYILRAWMEFVEVFLLYIQHGEDSPFHDIAGGIQDIWNRSEIQSNKDGKQPHQHTLIYFRQHPSTEEEAIPILQMIRGCIRTLASPEEQQELIEKGFIANPTSFILEFLQQYQSYIAHHCTKRCRMLCQVVQPDGTTTTKYRRVCKAPDNRRMNPMAPFDLFLTVDVEHSQTTLQHMLTLGMIEPKYIPYSNNNLQLVPKEQYRSILLPRKHIPSCYATDQIYSPCNPVLFGMLRSAMNVQYVTSYILLRYMAKYVASVDKANQLIVKATAKNTLQLHNNEMYNTKITRNAIAQEKTRKTNKFTIEGRALSIAQVLMQFLQYPTVRSTFRFHYLPTQPMGLRSMVKTTPKIKKLIGKDNIDSTTTIHDLDPGISFAGYRARHIKKFDESRQFCHYQVITFVDGLFQNGSIDKVTIFSLRPPELRWVGHMYHYYTWFERVELHEISPQDDKDKITQKLIELLTHDEYTSPWIDALNHKIKVRPKAIPKIIRYLSNIPEEYIEEDFGTRAHLQELIEFFSELNDMCDNDTMYRSDRSRMMKQMFLSNDAKDLPIYWYRTVKSTQGETFLIHLLLSLGFFTTELELLSSASLQQAFVKARLFTDSEDENEKLQSTYALLLLYITKQLCFLPAGTITFDNEFNNAFSFLTSFFVEGKIISQSLPSAMFTQLKNQADSELERIISKSQDDLLNSLYHHLTPIYGEQLPSVESVLVDRQLSEDFSLNNICPTKDQSDESFAEHSLGLRKVLQAISHYKQGSMERTKGVIFVGPGGAGKSIDMRLAGLQAMLSGLFTLSTTLTGKRSAEISGQHLHILFKIIVNDRLSVAEATERAYIRLLADPQQLIKLQRIDVLLIDELGQIDVRTLNIIDKILRKIRRSTHFMGGILVFATMDTKQLKPINGLPPLFSPSLLCSFVFHELKITLRTTDIPFQEIQRITRMPTKELLGEGVKQRFASLLTDNCKFVKSYEDSNLPKTPDVVYCFTHRQPCQQAENKVLQYVRTNVQYTSRKALNWEQMRTQQYPSVASQSTVLRLNNMCNTSNELLFYPYAPYEVSYNDKNGTFYHSQLCMLLDKVPSQEDLDSWKEIELYRAPNGVDSIPETPISEAELLAAGWEKIKVGKEPTRKYNLKTYGLSGYREQYGLRHRISATIHGIMGTTVSKLVTEISRAKNLIPWEPAMVVVLLSRTRHACDIYFIGDRQEIIDALWNCLLHPDQYSEYINTIMNSLLNNNEDNTPTSINLSNNYLFQQHHTTLPQKNEYTCYILISLQDTNQTYIGYTSNLSKRLNQHNSESGGSSGTNRQHLKPWGLLAYVAGFTTQQQARTFEGHWKLALQRDQLSYRGTLPPDQRVQKAIEVISDNNDLHLIICGTVKNN